MAWEKEIGELARRRQLAEQMGAGDRMARRRAGGRSTARERIGLLADPGSFQEIGALAGKATYEGDRPVRFTPSPTVVGLCSASDRRVVISADDATVKEEAVGTDATYKMGYAQKLALEWRLPLIRLLDDFEGSILEIQRASRTYLPDTDTAREALDLLQAVPVVSAVMGPVSGLHAVESCLAHFSVVVKGAGLVSVTPRPAADAAYGEDRRGGAGVVDNVAENEAQAFSMIRRFLGYLPDSVWEMPPRVACDDGAHRREEELLSIIPEETNKVYDPYRILTHVLDRGSLFEIAPLHGRSSITALARVSGHPVGVMAKNPVSNTGGGMDVAAGEKVIRLLRLCDTFHLPLVYFVDEPGFMIGRDAQREGIARAGARVVLAGTRTKMPWISFIVRQLYGVAGCLAFRNTGMCKHYGWATANWGGMHIEGGTSAAYRRVIESAPDPEAKRKEIESHLRMLSSIFRTAEAFEVEDIIDPRDTRPLLCAFVEAAQKVLKTQLGPGHGVIFEP